jgi:hypothetical protein
MNPLNLRRGDIVRLRREHPCGNDQFEVVRLGADIGLSCTNCGRRVLLARSLLERRMAGFVKRGADPQPPSSLDDVDLQGLDDADVSADLRPPSTLSPADVAEDDSDLDPFAPPRPSF